MPFSCRTQSVADRTAENRRSVSVTGTYLVYILIRHFSVVLSLRDIIFPSWKQEAKHLAVKSQERISELRSELRKLRAEKREVELRLHMQQFEFELSSKTSGLFSSGNHGDLDKAFKEKLDGILKGA